MFNQGQSNSRPSGLYHSPSTNDLRSKRGVFTNAGLSTLSGQDDSIQHNFRYQVDREKIRRDAEAAELNKLRRFQNEPNFQTLPSVHPNAYKSYSNNLDKIGHNADQVEAYANEVQSAKERLFQDQQSMHNLQKLNRLNAEQHKQHLQRQMNRIRDPVRENDFPPFRPAVNTKSVNNVDSRNYINDTDQDLKLSLLDKFSLNNGLEDQLSSFAPASGGLTGRSNAGLDNSRDYGDISRYMGTTAGTRVPTSSFRPNLMQRESREPVQQYSPYLPSSFNPQSPQYYPAPGYGYNAPPPSSENLEMKVYMQKQTDLLERISDKLAKRKNETREKPRRDTREFENRFRDFEKETELRLQLMKQQQTIENLQTHSTQPRQKQNESRQSRYRNNDESAKNHNGQQISHFHSQSQPDIFNPQNLVQSFMQHMNPFGYNNPTNNPLANSMLMPSGYDAYMNPYAYGMYPDQQYNMFSPYPYSASIKDKKKKKKHKKRAKSSVKSDSDDTDSDKSDSDSDDSSRKRSKSSKKKKDRKDKDKKSKDKKGSKKGGKDGGEDGGEGGLSPEEKKKKAQSNLRTILWTIVYQKIFETDISQKVTNRRAAHQQDIYNRLDPIAQNFATWLMNVAQEGFTKLFDDTKKTYDFVGLDFKKPARSDVVKRSAEAKKQTKYLIEILIAKTDANPIDNQNLEFLAGVCYKNVYLSDNTFSVFELMRIRSNPWGRIPEMTKEHSQMILTCLLIIRLLAFQLVFKASEWNKKIKWTPQALANFKIVGSLLYRIAYSMWEESLPIVTAQPSQLGCAPIPALTLDPILAPVDDAPDNPEMIFGALSKAQLAAVLEEDKQWTDSVKQLLLDWTSNIYGKIEAYRLQNPAKEPQLAGFGGGLASQAANM